jgi:large subunit ribosomal protein L6
VKFGDLKIMSRVGRKTILIPPGVQCRLENENFLAEGPKGSLPLAISPEIEVKISGQEIFVSLRDPKVLASKGMISSQRKKLRSLWGSVRNQIINLIQGVAQGYEKKLQIEGLGYRAQIENGDLVLFVGFNHPVRITRPEGLDFKAEKGIIVVSGADKTLVGQLAAKIRSVKPPDVYKGKGIRYLGEIIKKKAGKKAAATTTK